MRNAIATRDHTGSAPAASPRQCHAQQDAGPWGERRPTGGRSRPPSPAVRDLMAARLPPAAAQQALTAAPGWGPASLLCLVAWTLAGLVLGLISGPVGWLAGSLTLLFIPAAWLGWQLLQQASDEAPSP